MDRGKIIKDEIQKLHFSSGGSRMVTSDVIIQKIRVALEDWEEIPTDKIALCCRLVRRNKRGIIKNSDIVDEWHKIKFQDKSKPDVSKYGALDFTGAWVRYGTYYTWMTLPRQCRSDRMIELNEKWLKKTLTDSEAIEWEKIQNTKFDAHKVRLHPDRQRQYEKMGGMDLKEILEKSFKTAKMPEKQI